MSWWQIVIVLIYLGGCVSWIIYWQEFIRREYYSYYPTIFLSESGVSRFLPKRRYSFLMISTFSFWPLMGVLHCLILQCIRKKWWVLLHLTHSREFRPD